MVQQSQKLCLLEKVTPIVVSEVNNRLHNVHETVKSELKTELEPELKKATELDSKVGNLETRIVMLEERPMSRFKVHWLIWVLSNPLLLGSLVFIASVLSLYFFATPLQRVDSSWLDPKNFPIPALIGGLTIISTAVIKNYEIIEKGGQAIMKAELDASTRLIIKDLKSGFAMQRVEDQKRHAEEMKRLSEQTDEIKKTNQELVAAILKLTQAITPPSNQ